MNAVDVERALHDRLKSSLNRTSVLYERNPKSVSKRRFVVVRAADVDVEWVAFGPQYDMTVMIPVDVGTAKHHSDPFEARTVAFELAREVSNVVNAGQIDSLGVPELWSLLIISLEQTEAWVEADQRVCLRLMVEAKLRSGDAI